ncbi:MAG TPA: oligosaccharide flippase family protein [Bacteroidales bacterium]|nr:oligosaccharide flippase family protein [Bacteroidales bacterium]
MASLSKVFKNTILYSLSSIILRASSIIFFPIFSAYLTKVDYGIMSITQLFVLILMSLSDIQLPRGITRFLYDDQAKEKDYEKKLMGSSFLIVIIINVLMLMLIIPFGEYIFQPLLNDISFFPYMTFALAAVPFTIVFNQYKSLQKAKHNGKTVFTLDMLYFGGNILLNLLFVVGFKMDALGIILSTLVNSLIMGTYAFIKYYRNTVLKIDFKFLKPVLKYTIPLIPFMLMGVLLNSVDAIFLNSIQGAEISGIYYIALTFAALFSMFKESFNFAFTPWFFENFREENYQYIRKLFNIITWGAGFIALLISIFGYEVLYILSSNPELVEAWKYIPLATFGLLIVFIGQLYNLAVYYSKTKSNLLFISNTAGFIVNLLLCFAFASVFNPYYALIAKAAGFSVMGAIQVFLAVKSTDFKFNHLNTIFTLIIVGILSFMHYLPLDYYILLFIKLIIVIIGALFFIKKLKNTKIELLDFIKTVKNKFSKK